MLGAPWLSALAEARLQTSFCGKPFTWEAKRPTFPAWPGSPRRNQRMWKRPDEILAFRPCGKSGNRNGRSETAGRIVWPRRPRKILAFWIYGCGRSDTRGNVGAWQGLSRIKGKEELKAVLTRDLPS